MGFFFALVKYDLLYVNINHILYILEMTARYRCFTDVLECSGFFTRSLELF